MIRENTEIVAQLGQEVQAARREMSEQSAKTRDDVWRFVADIDRRLFRLEKHADREQDERPRRQEQTDQRWNVIEATQRIILHGRRYEQAFRAVIAVAVGALVAFRVREYVADPFLALVFTVGLILLAAFAIAVWVRR